MYEGLLGVTLVISGYVCFAASIHEWRHVDRRPVMASLAPPAEPDVTRIRHHADESAPPLRAELHFEFGSSRVEDAAQPLRPILDAMAHRSCLRVVVEGHSDTQGEGRRESSSGLAACAGYETVVGAPRRGGRADLGAFVWRLSSQAVGGAGRGRAAASGSSGPLDCPVQEASL